MTPIQALAGILKLHNLIRFFFILLVFPPTFLIAQTDTTATLVINNKAKYSKNFLSGLKSNSYSLHYQLIDSLLIIGQLDTAYFPTDLALNKQQEFTGSSKNTRYVISIKRINYTTIFYNLMIYKTNKLSYTHEGYADIGAGFFLGSEIDADEKTGIAYGSTAYINQMADCSISIRIGKNDEGKLCAKLEKHCKDRTKNIQIDDCPTLYQK